MVINSFAIIYFFHSSLFIDYLKKYTNILGRFSEEYDLDIFSNRHDILTDKAKKYPNTVYKPCGAGGDIGICFSLSEKTLETFESMACQNGFELLDLDLDESGFSLKG